MKNTILIISIILLVFVLVASLGGNAYQYYRLTQVQKQATSLQEDLSSNQSKLSKTTSELKTANEQISTLDNKISTLSSKVSTLNDQIQQAEDKYNDLDKLQSDTQSQLNETQTELDSTYCPVTIPIVDAMYTSTNSDLREPITAAVEKDYNLSSTSTSYTTIWNNSKDAIFTITLSNHTNTKVAVSWSWSNDYHIRAIYNISAGCYFYFDHTY